MVHLGYKKREEYYPVSRGKEEKKVMIIYRNIICIIKIIITTNKVPYHCNILIQNNIDSFVVIYNFM
jgi:hypothetical protein|tara:strand:- start:82 stop:282 length:201 start_codon:yes stop_codon:yes gene_type:complete